NTGSIRLSYSGEPATTDLTLTPTGTTAALLQAHLVTIPALAGPNAANPNVRGVALGKSTGPTFLVRFVGINNGGNGLARQDVGNLGLASTLSDGTTPITGTASFLNPSSGGAFAGAGEGFAGPGFVFTPGVTPNLADMQFYLSGISNVTALNTTGGVFLEGPAGNSSGPYTISYPAARMNDPIKV